MSQKKKQKQLAKSGLHPRNKHRHRYDFSLLIESLPELANYVSKNKFGDDSINFFDNKAVKALNKALLLHYYNLVYWEIPDGYLIPPVPGRADYIHHAADLLANANNGVIPTGEKIIVFDVGTGANGIYPILGQQEYGWSFIASDIDPTAISSSKKIVAAHSHLKKQIDCRLQKNASSYFKGILNQDEKVALSICNPPFHRSEEEALSGTIRKLRNLKKKKIRKAELNFCGKAAELWTKGGESAFIVKMVAESVQFANQCLWFSTLVSKESNLRVIYKALERAGVKGKQTISMGQGNKISRIVAWTFHPEETVENWM